MLWTLLPAVQMQEKLALTQLAVEERRMHDDLHAAEHARMETRHLQDVGRQQAIAGEIKSSLDAQVAAVRQRQLAEKQQEALEVHRMQQHWDHLQV